MKALTPSLVHSIVCACAALTALFAACSGPVMPQLFTLETTPTAETGATRRLPEPYLDLRPVQLASHLRNRAFASRIGKTRIRYEDTLRWADPLDQAITAYLRTVTGHDSSAPRFIQVRVRHFEIVRQRAEDAGGRLVLVADWTIGETTAADTEVNGALARGSFTASPRDWDGKSPQHLISLMHATLSELGQQLVKETEKLRKLAQ